LTPTALEPRSDPVDWMRREIEAALDSQRNIVPVMIGGFDFSTPAVARQLTGRLTALKEYNGLRVPEGYFPQAMERLRNNFLNVPVDAVLQSASVSARQVAREQKDKAARALTGEYRKREDEQCRNAAQAKAARQARKPDPKRGAEAEGLRRRIWHSAASALWPPSRPTLLVASLVGIAVLGAITAWIVLFYNAQKTFDSGIAELISRQ